MPLQKGDIIGGYEIISPLGQGGMATVFKAFHPRLNRYVAIKMIHQAYLQDTTYVARFEREAQIVAGLEHPNIVPVYDYSEYQGEPYLVMKLIEGSTLKQILQDGELPVEDILTIAAPIASALDYAHSKGVLHRDIKPSNIILDKQAWPYLSDFGLARLAISGASTLSQDLMIGTPYYMSPEQATGKREIDARADLYSFGVVLYELFVGKVPFSEGTPYAIINDHIARELPLPTKMNPNIPPRIEAVLLQALAKSPDDRYQSAAAMIQAVRDAVSTEAPQMSILSLGRTSAAQSLAKVKAVAPPPTPTPTPPATPAAATRKGQKTAAIPPTAKAKQPPPKKRSYTTELVLLGIALVLILVFVAFALSRNQANAPRTPAAVVQQGATLIVTLPPAPTVVPPTHVPTQNASLPILPPPDNGGNNGENNGGNGGGNNGGGDTNLPPLPPTMPIPPGMSAQEAKDAITHDPNNMGAYVALFSAQLQNNDAAAATRTYEQGLSHTKDNREALGFELTAAGIAVQNGHYDVAFALYSASLQSAQNQPPYAAVRATAGEFLYQAASRANQLTPAQITKLGQELATNTSPIVSAMVGRAFLANNNPRLALTSINAALGADPNLAEAHLVNGEYQQQVQNDLAKARSEWQLALAAADAPQWVHDRATTLLNSTQ